MSVEIWSGEELVAAAGFWFCSVEYSDDPEPNAGENANIMYEHKKDGSVDFKAPGIPKPKTSHSLNPVPCILYDPCYNGEYSKDLNSGLGISSIATTCMELLGFLPPADYDKCIVSMKATAASVRL